MGVNFPVVSVTRTGVETVPCPVVALNSTHITCTVQPFEGRNLVVTATVGGQPSTNSATYSFAPPTVTLVNPTTGITAGGTSIAVRDCLDCCTSLDVTDIPRVLSHPRSMEQTLVALEPW